METKAEYMKEPSYRCGRAGEAIRNLIQEFEEGLPQIEGNKKSFVKSELERIYSILQGGKNGKRSL